MHLLQALWRKQKFRQMEQSGEFLQQCNLVRVRFVSIGGLYPATKRSHRIKRSDSGPRKTEGGRVVDLFVS